MKIVHSKGRAGRVIFIKKIQDFRTIFDGGGGSKAGVTKATTASKAQKPTSATGRKSPFMKTITKHVVNPYNASYSGGQTVPGAYTKRNEERKKAEARAEKTKAKQDRETEATQGAMETSFDQYNLRTVSDAALDPRFARSTAEELYPGAGMGYDKGWTFSLLEMQLLGRVPFADIGNIGEQMRFRYENVKADDPRYFGQFPIKDDPKKADRPMADWLDNLTSLGDRTSIIPGGTLFTNYRVPGDEY